MAIRDKKRLGRIREILIRRRRELMGELDRTHIDAQKGGRPSVTGDLMDQANSNLFLEETFELVENRQKELAQVDEALRMLDNGEYGYCQWCGGTISAARLKAVPYATLCIGCRRLADSAVRESDQTEDSDYRMFRGEGGFAGRRPRDFRHGRMANAANGAGKRVFHEN